MNFVEEDSLTEDPVISNQKYFILSYMLPPKESSNGFPMIKVRGSFKDIDTCKSRIEELQELDGNLFNIYVAEVGKWGGLYPTSKVISDVDVEAVYNQEDENGSIMNNMMKHYKDNSKKTEKVFQERKRKLMDGTLDDEEYTTLEEKMLVLDSRLKSIISEKDEIEILKTKLSEKINKTPIKDSKLEEIAENDINLGSSSYEK
jgi:hypothetical protein